MFLYFYFFTSPCGNSIIKDGVRIRRKEGCLEKKGIWETTGDSERRKAIQRKKRRRLPAVLSEKKGRKQAGICLCMEEPWIYLII